MKVFLHHIYEYQKGLRNLILHTTEAKNHDLIISKLEKCGIDYKIYFVTPGKINVFFGNRDCVDVIKTIGKDNLCDYTDEEDFILGIMLGYDRLKQCSRYNRRKSNTLRAAS